MPRGERPLDEGDGPVLRFAADLRRLRASAGGPSYRELARRSHFSSTALSDAAGGRRLPGLEVVLGYVRACGGDEEQWRQRWHDVAAELAVAQQIPPAYDEGRVPYVGLAAFGVQDADRFFGREAVVETLLARLGRQRFVAVFGASGEGKSSLLRAGLVPKIRAVVFTPGPNPVEECAVRLAAHTGRTPGQVYEDLLADPLNLHRFVRCVSPDEDLVLVIDQFEEVFTLCADPARRSRFIDVLLAAVNAPNSRTGVVLGVRSDFYPHCAQYAALAGALTDAQILLGAMSPDELRRAITQPATKAGCSVESALLTTLVAEAAGRSGVLPLVSHALLETWRRRRGHTLTLAGYQAAGGIHGALARSAETVFAALTTDQQTAARQLLLRLTALGEGTEDTKRRIDRSDVPEMGPVLDVLAVGRLIILDQDSVEITHEALFRAWPRLREWLAQDRDGLRLHHQLTEAARIWDELERDPGTLYRSARLSLTAEWIERTQPALATRERNFFDASTAADADERHAAHRRARQLRRVIAVLTVLTVLATTGAVVAAWQRQEVEKLGLISQSLQLSALAAALASRSPDEALRASLEAFQAYPTVEARGRVLSEAAKQRTVDREYQRLPHASTTNVVFRPDGAVLLVRPTEHGALELWDKVTPERVSTIQAMAPLEGRVILSPDGHRIAAPDTLGRIVLWDNINDLHPDTLEMGQSPTAANPSKPGAMFFSPDGTALVATDASGSAVKVWDMTSRHRRLDVRPVADPTLITAVAIGPDNRTLAMSATLGEVELADALTGARKSHMIVGSSQITDLKFVSDGVIAVSCQDGSVTVWNTTEGKLLATLPSHHGEAQSLAITSDRTVLASAGADNKVNLWDLRRSTTLGWLEPDDQGTPKLWGIEFTADGALMAHGQDSTHIWHPRPLTASATRDVLALGFNDSTSVLSFNKEGMLATWRAESGLWLDKRASAVAAGLAQFSPDHKRLVVGQADEPVSVHDAATGQRITKLTVPGHPTPSNPPTILAFGNDSRSVLATGSDVIPDAVWHLDEPEKPILISSPRPVTRSAAVFGPGDDDVIIGNVDGTLHVHRITTPRHGVLVLDSHAGAITTLALSPDGHLLAAGVGDNTVVLWDTTTWQEARRSQGHTRITTLAFSPDGRRLAIGGADNTVMVRESTSLELWATLTGHAQQITRLAWSADSSALITAGGDHALTLWPLDVKQAVRNLCRRLKSEDRSVARLCATTR